MTNQTGKNGQTPMINNTTSGILQSYIEKIIAHKRQPLATALDD